MKKLSLLILGIFILSNAFSEEYYNPKIVIRNEEANPPVILSAQAPDIIDVKAMKLLSFEVIDHNPNASFEWVFPSGSSEYYVIFCDESGNSISQTPIYQKKVYVKWKNYRQLIEPQGVTIWTTYGDNFEIATEFVNIDIDIPTPTFTFNSNQPCYISTIQASIEEMTNWTNVFEWTLPSGWTANGYSGSVFEAGSSISVIPPTSSSIGDIKIRAKVTVNGHTQYSDYNSISITRNLPTVDIIGDVDVYYGENLRYESSIQEPSLNYSWQLPSGWTGSSNTYYIDATVNGCSGNVELTVTGCSDTKSANKTVTVYVADPNTVISGSDFICTSGSNFSIPDLTAGSSVTWSTSSNITRASTQGSNPCTFQANGNEEGWIEATISNNCGNITLPRKEVWVGKPGIPSTTPSGVPTIQMSRGQILSVHLTSTPGYTNGNVNWWSTGSIDKLGSGTTSACIFEATTTGHGQFFVTTENECGTSIRGGGAVSVSSGGGGGMMKVNPDSSTENPNISDGTAQARMIKIYPNPATEYLNISLSDELKNQMKEDETEQYEVILYDKNQQVVYYKKTDKKEISINLQDLEKGMYIIHFKFKEKLIQEKIIIAK